MGKLPQGPCGEHGGWSGAGAPGTPQYWGGMRWPFAKSASPLVHLSESQNETTFWCQLWSANLAQLILGSEKEKAESRQYLCIGCEPGAAPGNSQTFSLKYSQHPPLPKMDYTHFAGENIEVTEVKSHS